MKTQKPAASHKGAVPITPAAPSPVVHEEARAEMKSQAPALCDVANRQAPDWHSHNHADRAVSSIRFLQHFGLLNEEQAEQMLGEVRSQVVGVVDL